MREKAKTKIRKADAPAIVAVPRPEVSDEDIVAAVLECGGFPSRVADKFSMTIPDLFARAKASKEITGAFAEAKQRMVDLAKSRALSVMLGNGNTPPDPLMLRWFIERYE